MKSGAYQQMVDVVGVGKAVELDKEPRGAEMPRLGRSEARDGT